MRLAREGDMALLIGPRDKRFVVQLRSGRKMQTHEGELDFDALIGQPFGRRVWTHLGKPFLVLQPSVNDLVLLSIKRKGQIVYPKDAGHVLLKMNIESGCRVIEAGTGSGALTLVLARAVAPGGVVYSYEVREEMQENALRNLRKLNVGEQIVCKKRDVTAGFDEIDVDAVFLDVRDPALYLDQSYAALTNGGFFGSLVPTTNQVTELITELQLRHFGDIQVEELLVREYKPVPQRLRPMDTMVGHTGFLVFARKLLPFDAGGGGAGGSPAYHSLCDGGTDSPAEAHGPAFDCRFSAR